jgi:hypothetical protein
MRADKIKPTERVAETEAGLQFGHGRKLRIAIAKARRMHYFGMRRLIQKTLVSCGVGIIDMRIEIVCCTLLAFPLFTIAQVRLKSTSTFTSSLDGVIAQVADGASWKTIITLVNADTGIGAYVIKFYADDGSPMTLATTAGTANAVAGSLPRADRS